MWSSYLFTYFFLLKVTSRSRVTTLSTKNFLPVKTFDQRTAGTKCFSTHTRATKIKGVRTRSTFQPTYFWLVWLHNGGLTWQGMCLISKRRGLSLKYRKDWRALKSYRGSGGDRFFSARFPNSGGKECWKLSITFSEGSLYRILPKNTILFGIRYNGTPKLLVSEKRSA